MSRCAFVVVPQGSLWMRLALVTLYQVAAEVRSTRWSDGDTGHKEKKVMIFFCYKLDSL